MHFVGLFVLAGGLGAAEVEAMLLVMGDQHSAYSRTAQMVAHVDRLRHENPEIPMAIVVNGDAFEYGNVVAQRSEGTVDLAMFTAFVRRAPTVINLGNHEPEFSDVPATVERIRKTGAVPIGNLANRKTGELFAPAMTQLELGGARIVVAGITTDILAQYRVAVRPTLDLTSPGTWAREKFPELLARAPVRIVLSHAGLRLDREIFAHVPDGTLIAGAHDHAQYVERMGRSVYFHSGSWNGHLSIVRLKLEPNGPAWDIEQLEVRDTDPADLEMAALIRETESRHFTLEDLHPIGVLSHALSRSLAAGRVVGAVRRASEVDAAFIGNTTFGDGLPAGEVSRFALDACVRFDGTVWVGEISGAHLQRLLRASNQGADTPFVERRGEFQFADGPREIVAGRRYRIATNDWGARNRERYFGAEELVEFVEKPELRLKAIVGEALAAGTFAEK